MALLLDIIQGGLCGFVRSVRDVDTNGKLSGFPTGFEVLPLLHGSWSDGPDMLSLPEGSVGGPQSPNFASRRFGIVFSHIPRHWARDQQISFRRIWE